MISLHLQFDITDETVQDTEQLTLLAEMISNVAAEFGIRDVTHEFKQINFPTQPTSWHAPVPKPQPKAKKPAFKRK